MNDYPFLFRGDARDALGNYSGPKHNVVLADPPWRFKSYSPKGEGRSPSQHYDLMTLEDIARLPVIKLAADDCALFLWATYTHLEDAMYVLKAWGWEYSTVAFTWAKRTRHDTGWHFGLGYVTRANPEIVLYGRRGSPKRADKSVPNLVVAPVMEHSAKPEEVRKRIETLFGEVPRIELFARGRPAPSWSAIGNELEA